MVRTLWKWRTTLVTTVGLAIFGACGFLLASSASFASAGGWIEEPLPATTADVTGVSCPTITVCLASGDTASNPTILITTSGGSSWTSATLPTDISELTGISCASTSNCFAAGSSGVGPVVVATVNGGSSWTELAVPGSIEDLTGISCPTTSHCYASGDNGTASVVLATTNSGSSWTINALPAAILRGNTTGIACPSSISCFVSAADGAVAATVTSAASWTLKSVPDFIFDLTGISCPTKSECFMTGDDSNQPVVEFTTDSGSDWATSNVPADQQLEGLTGISCATTTDCLVAGQDPTSPDILVTHTGGGASFSTLSVPTAIQTQGVTGISCPSTTSCFAAGQTATASVVLSSTKSATSWTTHTLPVSVVDLTGISCPTSTNCFATGDNAYSPIVLASTNGGNSWSSLTVPNDVMELTGISCPTALDCYAPALGATGGVHPEVLSTTDGGSLWSESSAPGTALDLTGISCTSVSDCFLSGDSATAPSVFATTTGGTSWAPPISVPSSTVDLTGISCLSTSECFVSGDGLLNPVIMATADGGATWATTSSADIDDLQGISCPSDTECYAPGDDNLVPVVLAQSGVDSATPPTTTTTTSTTSSTSTTTTTTPTTTTTTPPTTTTTTTTAPPTTTTTTTTTTIPKRPISTLVSQGTVALGPTASVTDTAFVVGNAADGPPTGLVAFYACHTGTTQTLITGFCSASSPDYLASTPVSVASSDAGEATSPTFTPNATGSWCFSAVYQGDGNYPSVGDNTDSTNLDSDECLLVTTADSMSSSRVSSTQVTLGPTGTVTDDVTVAGNATGGPPTGNVAFYVCQTGATPSLATGPCAPTDTPQSTEGLVPSPNYTSSTVSASFTPSSPGTWCFSAVYGGDDNYTSSSDDTAQTNLDTNECTFVNAVAPAVTTQPASQTISNGTTATFTAAASGNPTPTVQWQSSTNGGLSFSPIPGATSNSYSLPATLSNAGTEVEAVFSNFGGSATSHPAAVGVLGGTVTPAKTTGIMGGTSTNVSGAGWYPLNGDTAVAIFECATSTYSPLTCDLPTATVATVRTSGINEGTFPGTKLTFVAGVIDSNGDTCGVYSPTGCYVVVRGSSGDSNFAALDFVEPTVTLKESTGIVGNFDNKLTTHYFPMGDAVTASECDSSATVGDLSSHCDGATTQAGTSGTGGVVSFADGVAMLVGSSYSDSAGGSCLTGATCYVEVSDATTPSIAFLMPAVMATPSLSITPTSGASGTKVSLSATGFPIGDPVNASECDTAATALNIGTNCDPASSDTGTVGTGASGTVAWSVTSKISILSGTTTPAYADTSSPYATCAAGDTVADHDPCYVEIHDTVNPDIVLLVTLSITT